MTVCVNCAKFKGCNLSSPNVNECADYKEILTNEEYIHSLNTEQLAETLAWIEDRGELPTVRKENVKAFYEWLKQPHTTIKE